MLTVISFVFALFVLILVHESGHFFAARMVGVKVKKFSIGFGKSLISIRDKSGMEWAMGWIPLGGYVSMLDTRDALENGESKDDPSAFNNKTPIKRAFVMAAGPFLNFFFAWFILSAMLAIPHKTDIPIMGATYEGSVAHKAGFRNGDTILTANGRKIDVIEEWQDVLTEWAISAKYDLDVKVVTENGKIRFYTLPRQEKQIYPEGGWLKAIGWVSVGKFKKNEPVVIDKMDKSGAFAKNGVLIGDKLIKINGEDIDSWNSALLNIGGSPGKEKLFQFQRNEIEIMKKIKIEEYEVSGVKIGKVGIGLPATEKEEVFMHLDFYEASEAGYNKTKMLISLTVDSIVKMLSGQGSSDQLSGPIGIAEEAGKSAKSGITNFLYFLAILSISLGVLNLLPIPVLDGGQLVMIAIEVVKGGPIPIKLEKLAVGLGFLLIGSLTIVGLLNDARKILLG